MFAKYSVALAASATLSIGFPRNLLAPTRSYTYLSGSGRMLPRSAKIG